MVFYWNSPVALRTRVPVRPASEPLTVIAAIPVVASMLMIQKALRAVRTTIYPPRLLILIFRKVNLNTIRSRIFARGNSCLALGTHIQVVFQ